MLKVDFKLLKFVVYFCSIFMHKLTIIFLTIFYYYKYFLEQLLLDRVE